MAKQGNLLSKTLVIGIIILLIGMSVVSSIGNIGKASSILGFTSTEKHLPVSKIACSGVFGDFSDVEPGQYVYGQIKICNDGDEDSFLNWHVDTTNVPTFGTWEFYPESDTNLSQGYCDICDVGVLIISEEDDYYGLITVYNSDNLTDYCEVSISIIPRIKATTYSLIQLLLDRFPLLEVFLRAMNQLR